LKELATLKQLTTLSLYGTSVTDEGVKELAALKNRVVTFFSFCRKSRFAKMIVCPGEEGGIYERA
jgi:hypothetical protein